MSAQGTSGRTPVVCDLAPADPVVVELLVPASGDNAERSVKARMRVFTISDDMWIAENLKGKDVLGISRGVDICTLFYRQLDDVGQSALREMYGLSDGDPLEVGKEMADKMESTSLPAMTAALQAAREKSLPDISETLDKLEKGGEGKRTNAAGKARWMLTFAFALVFSAGWLACTIFGN